MKKELKNTFDKTYLSIEYDQARQCYYNRWRGYITSDNIVEGSSTYLELLASSPCPRLLTDNRRVVGSWQEALDWLAKHWAPQASSIGLRWLAIVVSPGSFAVDTAEELQKRLASIPLEVRVFADLQTSKEWLESQRE
jgi:hypothetical protein